MKERRKRSPCARCPYRLGLIKTLVSPCPRCRGGGLWMAGEIFRRKKGETGEQMNRGAETHYGSSVKEVLIQSTCADLRQKFLLTKKKTAGILADFKVF